MEHVNGHGEAAGAALSSLSTRGSSVGASTVERGRGLDDVASSRLIELASRIACEAVNATIDVQQSAAPQSPVPGVAFSSREQLAERIAALAAGDVPGAHMIAPVGAPRPMTHVLPVAAATAVVPVSPRLADKILGQQAAFVEQAHTPAAAQIAIAPAPPMAASAGTIPLPIYPPAAEIGRTVAPAAWPQQHAPASHAPLLPPAPALVAATPADADDGIEALPPPPVPSDTWRDRLVADGLPGFIVGVFVAVAIGVALYILLHRL